MKFISIILLLPFISWAKIKTEASMVLPITFKNYPIESFVKDFAQVSGESILLDKELFKNSKRKVNLVINKKINIQDFRKMFFTILESHGFTAIKDGSFYKVINSRNIRYSTTQLYTSDDFPKTDEYIFVVHHLKNPLARNITRNMRPFLSRYGRIVDFSDAHSIALHDRGKNIKRLIDLINNLDNSPNIERLKKYATQRQEKQKQKILKDQLELDILTLQKEKLEKELGKNNSHPSKRRRR